MRGTCGGAMILGRGKIKTPPWGNPSTKKWPDIRRNTWRLPNGNTVEATAGTWAVINSHSHDPVIARLVFLDRGEQAPPTTLILNNRGGHQAYWYNSGRGGFGSYPGMKGRGPGLPTFSRDPQADPTARSSWKRTARSHRGIRPAVFTAGRNRGIGKTPPARLARIVAVATSSTWP